MPETSTQTAATLKPGRNCWRIEQADRAAFLVDAHAYFEALYDALARARKSVRILGWDIDSQMELLRPADDREQPTALREYLEHLARENTDLRIDILSWDFSVIYAFEREWFTKHRISRNVKRRVRFELDSRHPLGGSQHQKVVVIDDAVAFVGGLDLTRRRWDTPDHEPEDPRRVDPDGTNYLPFHDVQMAVDGAAARALAELAVERWKRATDVEPIPLSSTDSDPWPERVEPAIRNTQVAIARTFPEFEDRPEIREVERLQLDLIGSARKWIYCENQYVTSERISRALAERLREEEGPEVVLVTPKETRGWLERTTMDVLRARFLERLRDADTHGRLRVRYPHIPGLTSGSMMVHAKVTIVDDRLVRVGSANLSNRSMGLDSECDLAVEFQEPNDAIAHFRNRLMAEHLGTDPEEIDRRVRSAGSLVEPVDDLSREGRGLRDLDEGVSERMESLIPDSAAVDPEKPIESVEFVRQYLQEERSRARRRALRRVAVVLVLLGAVAAAWRWTPLGDLVGIEAIRDVMTRAADHPLAPFLVILTFVVGAFLGLPVTGMIGATGAVFGPWKGMALSLAGTLASAGVTFVVGKWVGKSWTRRLAGPVVKRIDRWIAKGGVPAVAALRLVPIAPFAVVNLALGTSSLKLRTFLLGTLAGMLPGIVALSWVGDRIGALLRRADATNLIVAGGVLALAVGGLFGVRRWLRKRGQAPDEAE